MIDFVRRQENETIKYGKNTCPLAVPALEHKLVQLRVGPADELEAELANVPELSTYSLRLNVERSSSIRLQGTGDTTNHVGDKEIILRHQKSSWKPRGWP